MEYRDFEIEIGIGKDQTYPVQVVHSDAGGTSREMFFPYDNQILANKLLQVENAVLRSSSNRRGRLLPEEQDVQEFGHTLFKALFAEEVGNLYAASLRAASDQGKGLRLKLRILSPQLATLPWEFLYDKGKDKYICLSNTTPVVRYPEVAQPSHPLLVKRPLRILGMISSPEDGTLDIEHEKEHLEKAIKDLCDKGIVKLTWLPGRTPSHLQRFMRQDTWHVFHFIGHGGFNSKTNEGYIVLENKEGNEYRLTTTQLRILLADYHSSLRLVVLNACEGARSSEQNIFSSCATGLIQQGIPSVLAMQYSITDPAAITLSQVFYETLADGWPVDAAVSEARKAISLEIENTLEWGVPVLYMRSPDGVLFDVQEQPASSQGAENPSPTRADQSVRETTSEEVSPGEVARGNITPLKVNQSEHVRYKADADLSFSSPEISNPWQSSWTKAREFIPSPTFVLQPPGGTDNVADFYLVEISPDGQTLVCHGWGQGGSVFSVWDLSSGQLLYTLSDYDKDISCVVINPDGQTLVGGSWHETIKVWDLHSGQRLDTLAYRRPLRSDRVRDIAISQDGQTLVGSSKEGIQVWDLHSRKMQRSFPSHHKWLFNMAISQNGQTLVSSSSDGTINVWDLSNGQLQHTLPGVTAPLGLVAISGDGQILVSNSKEGIQVWDLPSKTLWHTFTYCQQGLGQQRNFHDMAISQDGKTLVSTDSDRVFGFANVIKVWHLPSGQLRHTLTHKAFALEPMSGIAISQDGQILVSSGMEMIKVWDLLSGQLLYQLPGDVNIDHVAISRDKRTLVGSSGMHGTIQVWRGL